MSYLEELDTHAKRIHGMTTRYAGLRATLDDTVLVKKLLDSVQNCL